MSEIISALTSQDELRAELWGSFIRFCQVFFPLVTGRPFSISRPTGRESHFITIARELTKAARLEEVSLLINVPPGSGKSTMLAMWVAWTLSKYPDSQYLYISYGHELASKHTEFVRRIIQCPHYAALFGVYIRHDMKAKDHFMTTAGGSIKAFGSSGPVTGCFDYDAPVHTEHGLRKIGEIVDSKSRIKVWSLNVNTNSYELKNITNWFVNAPNSIMQLSFNDGSFLECTPDHKIWTVNRGWVRAENLNHGDVLNSVIFTDSICLNSGVAPDSAIIANAVPAIRVRNISPLAITIIRHVNKTYCLEVEDNHNFAIDCKGGAIIVSNCDAGLPNLDRFTGSVIMDDLLKPDDAHSPTVREGVTQNYRETILQRPRSPNVPMIYIGQRLHEDDICAYMLSGNDERKWRSVILQALDGAGNALYPEVNPKSQLLEKKEKNPYVFSSQYQQEPVPAGGALYKERDFAVLDEEPEFLCTFITCDTAETSKSYNDASAFSFWGLYKVADYGQDTEELALHWIDCWEIRVEPKELESSFKSFWGECMLHKTKPRIALIEKKSTGVTLLSVLQDMRGLELREVKRTKASGSKTARFLEMQPIIAAKLISFTRNAKHYDVCVKHMIKITANDSHKHDDIADSLYDGIKSALIDKTLFVRDEKTQAQKTASRLNAQVIKHRIDAIREARGY